MDKGQEADKLAAKFRKTCAMTQEETDLLSHMIFCLLIDHESALRNTNA